METEDKRSLPGAGQPVQPLTQAYFMLVKTTSTWLQLAPKERFAYLETTIRPIIKKWAGVTMRFFDTEAFTGRITDIILWETTDVRQYQHLIDELRETLFWNTYFDVIDIFPAIENAYADHYRVKPL